MRRFIPSFPCPVHLFVCLDHGLNDSSYHCGDHYQNVVILDEALLFRTVPVFIYSS